MIIDREKARSNYPYTLSLEDVRCILHISKRKAAWMLQNGIIKCEISPKRTKQYKVKVEDLLAYLDKEERGDSSVQIPIGIFNARKPIGKTQRDKPIATRTLPKKPTKAFRAWLTDKWSDESETLLTSDLSRLTCYTQQTVQRWMKQDKLRSVKAKNKLVAAKEWLIDFYCEEAYKIIRKSKKHIELMDWSYVKTEK